MSVSRQMYLHHPSYQNKPYHTIFHLIAVFSYLQNLVCACCPHLLSFRFPHNSYLFCFHLTNALKCLSHNPPILYILLKLEVSCLLQEVLSLQPHFSLPMLHHGMPPSLGNQLSCPCQLSFHLKSSFLLSLWCTLFLLWMVGFSVSFLEDTGRIVTPRDEDKQERANKESWMNMLSVLQRMSVWLARCCGGPFTEGI